MDNRFIHDCSCCWYGVMGDGDEEIFSECFKNLYGGYEFGTDHFPILLFWFMLVKEARSGGRMLYSPLNFILTMCRTIFMFCSKEQNLNLVPCWYRSNYLQVASFQHHDIGVFLIKNLMKTSNGIRPILWQNHAGTMQGSAFTPLKFNAVFSALPISGSWKLQHRDLWLPLQCGWVDWLAQRGYKAWQHRTVLASEEDSDC